MYHNIRWRNLLHTYLSSMLILGLMSIELVQSDHTTFCIALPSTNLKKGMMTIGMEKFPQTKELWGKFNEKVYGGLLEAGAALSQRHEIGQIGYPTGKMKVYYVKNSNTGQRLKQWFRIELSFVSTYRKSDLQESLKALILYVRDDSWRRQNIGEFAVNFPDRVTAGNRCPKNDANKYMVLPCGGASKAEPLVSNMIVLVRNNSEADGNIFPRGARDIIPSMSGKHSLNFYIRIPIQDCNQKKTLVFRARTIFDKNVFTYADGQRNWDPVHMVSLYWRNLPDLHNMIVGGSIPGAADALPSPSNAKHLDCSEEMTATNVPWYASKYTSSNLEIRHFNNEHGGYEPDNFWSLHGCQGFYFRGRCIHNLHTLYGETVRGDVEKLGLRQLWNQNVAEENTIPICEHTPDENDIAQENLYGFHLYIPPKKFNEVDVPFPKTHDYLKERNTPCSPTYNGDPGCNITYIISHLFRRSAFVDSTAVMMGGRTSIRSSGPASRMEPPKYKEDAYVEYVNYTGNERDVEKDKYKGIGFDENGFPKLIWGLRQGHATVMALVMLFLLPINFFVTRYYKESFMNKRILYSRVWYVIHVHGSFIMVTLLLAGAAVAFAARRYLGKSLTWGGLLHRAFGWMAIFLFIGMMAVGGFRGFEDPLRKTTIFLHWLFGQLFYILMVAEMITALYIPGNGVSSSITDPSTLWRKIDQFTFGPLGHIIAWIIIELVLHAVMTVNMCGFDKKMDVVQARLYFPVPIPVIREHSRLNTTGHGLRVICLYAYLFLALCSTTWYIINYIITTKQTDLGLGPMYCTHENDGTYLMRHNLTFDCY